MISPIRLAHIVFRTRDLPRLKDWYCNALGAHMVNGNNRIAFLTYDEEHHRIAIIASPDLAERALGPSVGFYHAAFTFAGLDELMSTYDRLKEGGILPYRTINHGPTISFYYRDPDGNEIEFQVDRFDSAVDAQEWMKGEAFTKNPIGIELEVEDLRRRMLSGEPRESIMRRADEAA